MTSSNNAYGKTSWSTGRVYRGSGRVGKPPGTGRIGKPGGTGRLGGPR